MVEACYITFHGQEEYDMLAERLDNLGFVWGNGQRTTEWYPANLTANCLHIDPVGFGFNIYQLTYIPEDNEVVEYGAPFITAAEFLGLNEKFNDSISFEAVMGL